MFKVEWDKETGGVRLSTLSTKDTLGVSPRPVFFEELDLLKLNEMGWTYPHCKEPLLWACNKQYYYRGELVFEAKGANIYDAPTITFAEGKEKLTLQPVDVQMMLERCTDEMFLVESEAIEFIRDVYVQYSSARKSVEKVKANQLDFEALVAKLEKSTKQKMAIVKQDCDSFDIMPLENAKQEGKRTYAATKIDVFLASFSGGKDSQVVLDLCTRAIPPQAFEVIYSDTGYELPTSLTLYDDVQEHYKELYPELRFRTARNHESVLKYWDKIGTPSDTHRWCCSVMKTAPLYKLLKVDDSDKQAKVLTFDGVRAEESTKRSTYARIGKGVKHSTVINASPILHWNTTEIFLYLFRNNLPINCAYRYGMTRVGCLICPFSSEWNDMISNKQYHNQLMPFLNRIEKITKKSGVIDIDNYIGQGNWKRRAGGRGIEFPSHMEILSVKPDMKIKCSNPQIDILKWLPAVGAFQVSENKGEIKFEKSIYKFSIEKKDSSQIITFEKTYLSPVLQGMLKRALYKATYCIKCESCEVECPTGALTILPEPFIKQNKCIHCHKCLEFHDFGCVVANSLNITGVNNNNKMKLVSYNNFGLKEEWLDMYFASPETYFRDNLHGLHLKEQLPNFIKWIVQAEILNDNKSKLITETGKILAEIYRDNPQIVWEIIWINLSYNAPIAKWYKENVDWNFSFTEADIRELLKNDYPTDSPTTIRNIVYALARTFKESPIGEMGLWTETEKLHFKKMPYNDLSREAIAYSLYKYAEAVGTKSLRMSDLYQPDCRQGVYREFGIAKTALESQLRSLNSDTNRVLVAELNMGLDSITLRDDLNALEALKILTR